MKKQLFALAILQSCAASDFYVKEESHLSKVSVHECRITSFRNIEGNEVIKKELCKNMTMTPQQKTLWEKMSVNAHSDDDND